MAAFTPTEDECRQGSNSEQTNEFIFVVDCSGSMRDENKIDSARQAMLVFHKSLPVDCQFNIIRFGSRYNSLFPQITAVYNEENARKAEELINGMQADLGGTELMKPLQWIEQNVPSQGRVRQIFLLTDGEISNVSEVLDLCRSMATSARIFSFGLGTSPSRSLVKGLARTTNGRFVFIPPNSSVDIYVGEQLQKALQSCLTNVQVKWNLGGVHVENAPKQTPPVYANDRLIVYALTNDKTIPFDHNSSVELQIEPDHRSLGIAKVNQIPFVAENQTIARLAAKALILELQHEKFPTAAVKKPNAGSTQPRFQHLSTPNKDKMEIDVNEQTAKQRIIDLSLKYNILSPHTAFVGIEKRTNASNADMVLREIPIQISANDQHLLTRLQPMVSAARGGVLNQPVMSCASREANERALASFFNSLLTRKSTMSKKLSAPTPLTVQNRMDLCHTDDLVDCCAMSSTSDKEEIGSSNIPQNNTAWPSSDQEIVRYLINKQKFDGLWSVDDNIIRNLTGKSLSVFQSTNSNINDEVLASIIIILQLESRFIQFSSLWHGIVQKACKRINDLLKIDSLDYNQLADSIRKQF